MAEIVHTSRTTFWDMVEHLLDFLGADVQGAVPRVIRRSIHAAWRQFPNEHNWSYYYQHGRINFHGPQQDGTIAYDHTGGTYERMVTLTGATWPSWAALGVLRIGNIVYQIDRRISDTVVTLDPVLTPSQDIASGTAYILYQDTYTLPSDFVAMDRGLNEDNWYGMYYVHPTEWLAHTRWLMSTSNSPRFYSITGSPDQPGRMALRVYPYPDRDRTLDFIYRRRPRPLLLDQYTAGSASATAGSTTITGNGTSWTASMEGSVIRLADQSSNLPTGLDGDYPYALERTIKVVTSATQLEVDEAADRNLTNVKYRISDPIDVEDGAMLEAFVRLCELHAGVQRKHKDRPVLEVAYRNALILAKEAESRVFQRRVAGVPWPYRQRLAHMPRGPDIP